MFDSIHDVFRRQGLIRTQDGRVLGGVLAGLGRRLGLDPWPTRLLFIGVLLLIPGSQFLVYPILWVLMPMESDAASDAASEAAAFSAPAAPPSAPR